MGKLNLPENYWDNKFWAYMHDPFDKAFDIKGHIKRAKELTAIFGIEQPNEQFWKKADGIASGFERGQIISYSKDESKSGAIDFLNEPILTHPTGKECKLKIKFNSDVDSEKIWNELKEYIKKDIGTQAGKGGYSDLFKGDEKKFSIARFLYTHLVLRFKLANDNVGDIGALWHRLPADTRFPDHSIWQHNALVSAIQSCFELGEDENDLGLMVFSITPVQGFISNARKLRDYWTGSILLSWLAFEGIKWVIENLGPDHILYPSLIDQYLINEYLLKHWKVREDFFMNKESKIASFPNKFLFLIPFSKAEIIGKNIEERIKEKWEELWEKVFEFIFNTLKDELNLTDENREYIKKIFERQNQNFWELTWASAKLINKDNEKDIKKLLSPKYYENQFKLLEKFLDMIKNKDFYDKSGIGTLYSVSHSLCQAALASQKTRRKDLRELEPGEKCHICGEFEVLHHEDCSNKSAKEYKKIINKFQESLLELWKNDVDFKENERLCSICLIKRIAYKVISGDKEHILNKTFSNISYPSTTEIALYNFYKRNNIKDENLKKKIAQELYNNPEDKISSKFQIKDNLSIPDRYYAILLMDGDNMGKLINGETIASTWKSIMHPTIVEKIKNSTIDKVFSENWTEIFEKLPKRNITPAIHLTISEALGDFAVYGVSSIIKKYDGKLIYAGGDDVCAVLPIEHAISAADEIQQYYKTYFRLIDDSKNEIIENEFTPQKGKLSINLGVGEDISISAGILICHHKENLSQMIKTAHILLEHKAKKENRRNSIAIQLRKRSGGDRFFVAKWNDDRFNAFISFKDKMGEEVSRSLAYRLAELKDGLIAIYNHDKELLPDFIEKQLDKSKLAKDIEKGEIAKSIALLIFNKNGEFNNDPLIIAGFLSKRKGS